MLINTGRPACTKHTTHTVSLLALSPGIKWNCGALFGRLEYAAANITASLRITAEIYTPRHTPHTLITASPPNLSRSFPFQFPAFKQQAAAAAVHFYCAIFFSDRDQRCSWRFVRVGSALNSGVVDLAFNYGHAMWCHFYCGTLFSHYTKMDAVRYSGKWEFMEWILLRFRVLALQTHFCLDLHGA